MGTKMGFPLFLSEIVAIASQKSALEANLGSKKTAVPETCYPGPAPYNAPYLPLRAFE